MIRAHVIFKGRVQGVFFRAHTMERANELGVRGWVRNLGSGDVEALFEGEEDIVKELIEYCKSGQPHAKVRSAEVEYSGHTNEFEDFKITH